MSFSTVLIRLFVKQMYEKILVLFPNDWDKAEFSKEKYQSEYTFIYEGPNLFKFPIFLQLN